MGAYFAVSDAAKEIGTWDSRLQVTSRGYMLGYNDLRDPSVSGFFRFLARVGDKGMKNANRENKILRDKNAKDERFLPPNWQEALVFS